MPGNKGVEVISQEQLKKLFTIKVQLAHGRKHFAEHL